MQEKAGSAADSGAPRAEPEHPSPKCVPLWRRWTGHGIRLTFWSVLALTLLFAGAVAVTRFWLVPNADSFRPRVVEELTRLSGQRVVIGGFQAGWNGWSPELKMTRLQMLDARGRTLLQLPEVDTTISWRSLFFFEPRLSALTVRAPRVIVRRTAENALTVAGIDLDLSAQTEGDSGLIEWLLKQRLVQIAGGEVEWQDEWRKLPPLRLRNVNIRLQNDGRRHSVGMTAVPPTELAAPLDLRCEFTGTDLRKVSDWDGLAYLRADYANIGTLSRYFPLPVQISRGEGGMQVWFEFDDGKPVAVTTDMVVRNARLQLPSTASGAFSAESAPAAPGSAVAGATTAAPPNAAMAPEPIDLHTLSGRLSWREKRISGSDPASAVTQQRWSVRDLVAVTTSGLHAPSSNGEVLVDYRGGQVTGGALRAPAIDVGAATPLLKTLPLPADVVTRWLSLQPTGHLRNIDLRWRDDGEQSRLGRFHAEGAIDLDGLSWRAQGSLPGVSGLSARFTGSTREGEVRLAVGEAAPTEGKRNPLALPTTAKAAKATDAKQPLALDFGSTFSAPLSFDAFRGKLAWKRSVAADGSVNLHVDASDMEVGNADALAKFAGSWDNDKLGPGVSNISGTLVRADATSVHRYLPTSVSAHTREWLRQAIVKGDAKDARFIVEGALWHFPFHNDQHGVFEIDAQVAGGILDYADRWPRAESINTRLLFRGSSLHAQVAGAVIAGVPVAATEVKITDMSGSPAVLDIKGGAAGPMDAFLHWVVASPVNGWLDGFLANAKATGNARLSLSMSMPLDDTEKTQLNGELTLAGNRIDLGGDIPVLDGVNGRLRFTQAEVRATDVAAEALGGPLRLSIGTEAGRVKAHASGTAMLERVRERYAYPLVEQLAGSVQWQLDFTQPSKPLANAQAATAAADGGLQLTATTLQPRWPLDSIMQVGTTPRDVTVPIKAALVRTSLERGRDRVTVDIPGQLHSILERSAPSASGLRTVERATLDLGTQRTALPARGYALRGDLARIDADVAMALLTTASATGGKAVGGLTSESSSADFVNINLRASEAVLYGHRFNDVSLRAQPSGQRWRLALRSKEATGAIALDTHADTGAVDAVSIRLQRLSFPAAVTPAPGSPLAPATANAAAQGSTRWPKLELVADAFVSEGRDLGKLEVKAQPARDEWQIEQVKLSSSDGSIEAKGRWRPAAPTAAVPTAVGDTEVDVALRWNDAGKFMNRFGLPKGVERVSGTLSGTLHWAGSPSQFNYARLGGKFTLETAGGRFTEMEPGIAKLLGVLSLQSLPRRLTFNFDDLFGKGFAFDEVKAEVAIADGVARTDGFAINGPSARVQIRGSADINRETQDLQVRVYPSLSTATAIGIGLVTANPAIGAAALLGQKLARDPIERMLMQEFEVTGTWTNPDVKQTRAIASGTTPSTATQ